MYVCAEKVALPIGSVFTIATVLNGMDDNHLRSHVKVMFIFHFVSRMILGWKNGEKNPNKTNKNLVHIITNR